MNPNLFLRLWLPICAVVNGIAKRSMMAGNAGRHVAFRVSFGHDKVELGHDSTWRYE